MRTATINKPARTTRWMPICYATTGADAFALGGWFLIRKRNGRIETLKGENGRAVKFPDSHSAEMAAIDLNDKTVKEAA